MKFTGTCTLEDKQAREQLQILWTKVETLNERSKKQTKEIQELRKELKKMVMFKK